MLERTPARALPLLNRAVDVSPAMQACCGVCRSCMTTNVLAAAGAVLAAGAVHGRGLVLRARRKS
jgi:hypothetical protein